MTVPTRRIVFVALSLAAFAAGGYAAEPSFAGVNGWGPLAWGMNRAEAEAALTKAAIAYEEAVLPGGDGPALVLTRAGWSESIVQFDAAGRLLAVDFVSERLKEKVEAAAYRADLEKHYGPGEVVPSEAVDDGYTDVETVFWRNDTTILTLNTTYYMPYGEWEVEERFVPASEPGVPGR